MGQHLKRLKINEIPEYLFSKVSSCPSFEQEDESSYHADDEDDADADEDDTEDDENDA